MAESEIPEDIRAKALAVSLCHQEPRGCVHPNDNSCEDGCELYTAIAKALLAERERCAKIAQDREAAWSDCVAKREAPPFRLPTMREKSCALEAGFIAAAIRHQDNPNET